MNKIAVVYTTDENFIYPVIVSIVSMLENANASTFYNIYLLISDSVTNEDETKFCSLKNKYNNFNINFIRMGKQFKNIHTGRVKSEVIFYRLKLSSCLPAESKCIYLDGDTLVLGDLFELFSTNIADYYVAGCSDNFPFMHKKAIGLQNDIYINAGVLLFNLEKIRKDNIDKTIEELIIKQKRDKCFLLGDQDIINIAFANKKLPLALKFNLLEHLYVVIHRRYTLKELKEALSSPVVVHFTWLPPWKSFCSVVFHKEWWKYAKKSSFIHEIEEKYVKPANYLTNKRLTHLITKL